MRHRVAGRKLGRTTAHRVALLRNLSTSLFDKERLRTTLIKAKELRPFAERLVTLAKRETLQARRQVLRHIHDRKIVAKLFDTLSARYAQRPGGYTRIIKLGPRRGDNAEMAIIELVGNEPEAAAAPETGAKKKPGKKAAKAAKAASKKAPAKKAKARGKKAASKKSAGKKATSSKGAATRKATSARKKAGAKSGE